MKLKIISDGDPRTTKVVDVETGKTVANVTKIEWSLDVSGIAQATITLVGLPVEIELSDPYIVWRQPE
jgi:hypothetical protein